MKDYSVNSAVNSAVSENGQILNALLNYVLLPLRSGILGFTLFFGVVLAAKWLSGFIHPENTFTVNTDDVSVAATGFFFVGLIRFLENFSDKK